jgi:hypothetical protein
MSKKVDMNVFLHFILVIKQMNDFTVTEAKNALLLEYSEFTDENEARKFIYRQLTRNVDKGLLKRTDKFNNGIKKIIYSKTESFFSATISPISRGSKAKKTTVHSAQPKTEKTVDYQGELKKELLAYEIDLNTTLEEAKEYKRLSARFPNLKELLQQHHTKAKEKSIKLLGRINALQNLLGYTVIGHQPC